MSPEAEDELLEVLVHDLVEQRRRRDIAAGLPALRSRRVSYAAAVAELAQRVLARKPEARPRPRLSVVRTH